MDSENVMLYEEFFGVCWGVTIIVEIVDIAGHDCTYGLLLRGKKLLNFVPISRAPYQRTVIEM